MQSDKSLSGLGSESRLLKILQKIEQPFKKLVEVQRKSGYYPKGISEDEINEEARNNPSLVRVDTIVRRDSSGKLYAIPFSSFFKKELSEVINNLRIARSQAPKCYTKYLDLLIKALISGKYEDMVKKEKAWVETEPFPLSIVINWEELYGDSCNIKGEYSYCVMKRKDRESDVIQEMLGWASELKIFPHPSISFAPSNVIMSCFEKIITAGHVDNSGGCRGWTLPNAPQIKKRRILYFTNVIESQSRNEQKKIADEIFDKKYYSGTDSFSSMAFIVGHEVSHNFNPEFSRIPALNNMKSEIEECKATLLGYWMLCVFTKKGFISEEKLNDITLVAIIQSMHDLYMAQRMNWRKAYELQAMTVLGVMLDAGVVQIVGERIKINFKNPSGVFAEEISELCDKCYVTPENAKGYVQKRKTLNKYARIFERVNNLSL